MLGLLVVIFLILLFVGVPIGYSMAISATTIILLIPDLPTLVVAQKMFTAMDSFSLMAVPFFMLAGSLMAETGITHSIVGFADALVGHIKGGIGHTAAISGMLMAGISGSANADAAALGAILVPTLKENGYEEGFAVSLVSAAGTLAPIIPPSIMMILYAGITNMVVGELFMAGVIPGILMGGCYMVMSYFHAKNRGLNDRPFVGWKKAFIAIKNAIWALLMPVIVLGGVLSGIVTATEAGVVACFYGIFYGFITRKLSFKKLWKCAEDAATSTAVTMLIIAFATLIGYLLAREDFSEIIMSMVTTYHLNKYVVLAMIVVLNIFLGMFIDANAICLMVVPVVYPVLVGLGFDPLHFAVVILISLVIGGLSPPVGMVLYIVASVSKTPLEKVVKPVWFFVLADVIVIAIVMALPFTITFIPSLMH